MNLPATQLFDTYDGPAEVYEGRNWITSRLIMARAFHSLDLIEDACSFADGEAPEQLASACAKCTSWPAKPM